MILPPATIGILGSGQLGRMLALEARRMGYRIHVYSPDHNSPTGQIADLEIAAPYEDLEAVRRFAQGVEVVTFEFENVPSATAEAMAELTLVRPQGSVLHITQNRAREKAFLASIGIPTAPFAIVNTLDELYTAIAQIGTPAVLKTAAFGYDGKGQAKIFAPEEAESAWHMIGQQPAVLEGFVNFALEISVVAAYGANGDYAPFPLFENHHANHILDLTISPARIPDAVAEAAQSLAFTIMKALNAVGVMGIELFLTHEGQLLVNELAPRTHNSGHLTFGGCTVSQFEQQLRAICGLPLGTPHLLAEGVAMANLLGDVWAEGTPAWDKALALPGVSLHLYGKADPRPGRKMGHLTALADSPTAAATLATLAREQLEARDRG
jgi:5-(carboxyamino)imidazole ribonucleotide synthase